MKGNDVSEAVVEVAWAALVAPPEAKLKELLAAEVIENDTLPKSLSAYRRGEGDAGSGSASSPRPTPDIYDKLRDKLSSPEFLHQLSSTETETPPVIRDQEKGLWLFVADENATLAKEERDELGSSEGYVVITQQDVVDGVACFVARSISALPQTKNMSPDALQQAIITAFSELQTTGKLRSLWSCAHLLYAATSWGSTALGLYKNPVIRRAAWMAVYTSSSIILRLFP